MEPTIIEGPLFQVVRWVFDHIMVQMIVTKFHYVSRVCSTLATFFTAYSLSTLDVGNFFLIRSWFVIAFSQADPEGMQNFWRRATSHLEVVETRRMYHLTTF